MKPTPSLAVIYFGVGFTLAGTLTMVALTLLRPALVNLSSGIMALLMFAPLLTGVAFGLRISLVGMRRKLKLGAALKAAVGLG